MGQDSKSRTQTLYARDFASDNDFRAAIEQKLVDIFPVLDWGRGVTVAPIRVQKADGTYATEGAAFQEVFMPAVRAVEPEPLPQPEESELLSDDELIAGLVPAP